jgi:uncharacterized protein (TIGR02996 family)
MSEAEAFERAIREDPDDVASYSAYADWLQEHDDPQGEFIAVQLALEDASRPKKAREELKKREAELLAEHERDWLGELAPYTLDRDEGADDPVPYVDYWWRRGFLSALDAQCVTVGLGQAIASAPAARFLRELRIRASEHYHSMNNDDHTPRVPTPPGVREHCGYFELLGSPVLEGLRVLRTGDDEDEPPEAGWCDCHCHLDGLEHLLVAMPRIEEMHLLCNSIDLRAFFGSKNPTRLRVFRAYHIGEWRGPDRYYEYPLDVLAANPAFGNLTHLQFHPHFAEDGYNGTERSYIPLAQVQALVRSPHLKKLAHLQLRLSDAGDDGVREIIASGILKQLKWLDLRHGCVTDEGAKLFAACPDMKRLERLDLSNNGVTAAGLAALRAAGVNAVANNPLTQGDIDSREYLRQGDFE